MNSGSFPPNFHPHLLICLRPRRDPEGIFAEPVTDDIAPGYSALIKHPMDLSTMGTKVASHAYCSAEEFKSDFVLMCKNAMTYNSPETLYYSVASNVMKDGLKLIEKVSFLFLESTGLTDHLNSLCLFCTKVMWCVLVCLTGVVSSTGHSVWPSDPRRHLQ